MKEVCFILGAGLGTRLKPLTDTTPKPLLYLKAKRAIEHIFENVAKCGIDKIIVNTHHLADEYKKAYPTNKYLNSELIFVNEPILLDTGGGIKNICKKYIDTDSTLLVCNGDIFFDGSLCNLLKANNSQYAATLLVLDEGKNKNVSVKEGLVSDMRFTLNADSDKYAQFSGIFVANKKFLECAANFEKDIFSSVDVFLKLLKDGEKLQAYFPKEKYQWSDIGTFSDYISSQCMDINLNRSFFESLNIKDIEVVNKGASDRKFFKLNCKDAKYVACVYSPLKHENILYANIAKFLSSKEIAVPKVVLHCAENNLLVMENAGDIDLLDICKGKSESFIISKYAQVAKEIEKLHRLNAKCEKDLPELAEPFSHKLYEWERNYFKDNFVIKHLGLEFVCDKKELEALAGELLKDECLVHRDFQSQNIMCRQSEILFIDFQGLRFGNKYYDYASLIFDPYTDFDLNLREKIADNFDIEDKELFYKAACQRLMQALGAYAFLTHSKGRKEYVEYMPKAAMYLEYCSGRCGLEGLNRQIKLCIKRLKETNLVVQ